MKKIVIALFALSMFVTACNNKNKNPDNINQMFCGRWMTGDSTHPNKERFSFKKDGSFTDVFYTERLAIDDESHFSEPKSWRVAGDRLLLTYSFKRSLFRLFKMPIAYTLSYTIKDNTDSSMVLATTATQRYPERIISLKRMKLNGQYIME